jgi:hypothetical protein
MKQILSFYVLVILFTLLIVSIKTSINVFYFGEHDVKFGQIGTITFSLYLSGICSSVVTLSATMVQIILNKKTNNQLSFLKTLCQTFVCGLVIAYSYIKIIVYAPTIDIAPEWSHYIVYFLVFGGLLGIASFAMCPMATLCVIRR